MKPYEIVCLEGVPEQKRLFCLSLQGILNREEPRLYFLDRENGPERHWIDWYRGYGLEGETISTDTLIEKHASIARGYILFDPECGESANAALSLAGIEAYPVLIRVGSKMDEEVPLPYFNHAVTAVKTDKIPALFFILSRL